MCAVRNGTYQQKSRAKNTISALLATISKEKSKSRFMVHIYELKGVVIMAAELYIKGGPGEGDTYVDLSCLEPPEMKKKKSPL